MGRRIAYVVLLLILLICLLPAFGVIWSSNFAAAHGCTLHEGFVNPCIVDGVDYGERLYTAFVMGWYMLLTLPVALPVAVALLIMLAVDVMRWLRRKRA